MSQLAHYPGIRDSYLSEALESIEVEYIHFVESELSVIYVLDLLYNQNLFTVR